MYTLVFTNRMKRDLKLAKKRGKDISKLETVLEILLSGDDLPEIYKDHQLKGEMREFRECHIEPDWLLIYKYDDNELVLLLVDTGSHSEILML